MRRGVCLLPALFFIAALFAAPALCVESAFLRHAPAESVKIAVIESLGVDKLSDKDLENINIVMGKTVFDQIFDPNQINKSTMDALDYIIALSNWRGRTPKDTPLCFMPQPPAQSQPYLYELMLLYLSLGDSAPEKLMLYVLDGTPLIGMDYYSYHNPMRYWITALGIHSMNPLSVFDQLENPNYPVLRTRRGPFTAWIQGDYLATGEWAHIKFRLLMTIEGEGTVHADSPACYRSGMLPAYPTTWLDGPVSQ